MWLWDPLAPAIADICMNWLLEEVFKKTTASFKIFRYVDDLFLAFDNSADIEDTFNAFNSIHNKIQFTREPEVENQLTFLDVHITKTREGVETKIFRKPTFTGLYINWQSYVPLKYKKNLLFTLLDRAYKICNSYAFIHQEFQKKYPLCYRRMVFQLTLLITTLPNFSTKNTKDAKPLILQNLPNLDCYLFDYRTCI